MGVVTVTVQTKPTRLLSINPKRVNYTLFNDSSTNVYIGFDKNVSTTGKTKGIRLAAGGGYISDEHHKGEVWAIASSATEVTVVEVTLMDGGVTA